MTAEIINRQTSDTSPNVDGLLEATSPLLVPVRAADRLAHFDIGYRTTSDTHLARFLKVLLGDAGIGGVRKGFLGARLSQTLQGSNFFDLDRFYGALFALRRRVEEIISGEVVQTSAEWNDTYSRDALYRSRIQQFTRALSYGGSPTGMELLAEAVLNVDCDVYETYLIDGHTEYGPIADFLVGQIKTQEGTVIDLDRWTFTVRPRRPITPAEDYNLRRVLRLVQPAYSRLIVDPAGPVVHTPIALRAAVADSNYWEIRSLIQPLWPQWRGTIYNPTPSADPTLPFEQPRYPFSNYQGEAWSYNADVIGVVGYSENGFSLIQIPGSGLTRVVYRGGYFDLYPSMALQSLVNTNAGRAASDGILTSDAFALIRSTVVPMSDDVVPVSIIGPAVSQVETIRIDGVAVTSAIDMVNQAHAPGDTERIWATASGDPADRTREIIEFRLSMPRFINSVMFEVSHYPTTVTIEAWDLESGEWTSVNETTIRDSIPAVLEPNVVPATAYHPQHFGDSHWVPLRQRITPLVTDRIRVVMVRVVNEAVPRDYHGQKFPYSLAIRKVDIGFRITSLGDVPKVPGDNPGTVFSGTKDILGSDKQLLLYRETGSNLLDSLGGSTVWRSEPQPVSRAVVNLYLDTRTTTGDGQVIDRFYISPLTTGVSMNLYHSDERAIEGHGWEASDDILRNSDATVTGTLGLSAGGIIFNPAAPSALSIPNLKVQWTPADLWWMAVEVTVGRTWDGVAAVPLVTWGSTKLQIKNMRLYLVVGSTEYPLGTGIQAGNTLRIILTSHPTDPLTGVTWVIVGKEIDSLNTNWVGALPDRPTTLVFGSASMPTPFVLDGFSIHEGETMPFLRAGGINPLDMEAASEAERYISALFRGQTMDPDGYGVMQGMRPIFVKPVFEAGKNLTDNAIIRYHPDMRTPTETLGFRVGMSAFHGVLNWNPVARDYILQEGFLSVPPVKAKYWKCEFTNLMAVPYESFVPITRTVKTFPNLVPIPVVTSGTVMPAGVNTNIELFGTLRYLDMLRAATFAAPDPSMGTRTNTSALYVRDLASTGALASHSALFGLQPFQQGVVAPMFSTSGVHVYETTVVQHSSKVGFFVGLKEITLYRFDHLASDDTTVYRDHFWDDQDIASSTFEFNPNRLYTDAIGLPSVATSKIFPSHSPISGLQFATQQTEGIQIAPDDEFRDPFLIGYDWSNNSLWHSVGDATLTYAAIDATVTMTRLQPIPPPPVPSGTDLGIEQPLPHIINDIIQAPVSRAIGGIESGLIPVGNSGMIHAAVRFTANSTVTAPIYLQIIATNGEILVSKQIAVTKGQTIEEYVSYRLNSYVPHYASTGLFTPLRTIADRPIQPLLQDPALAYGATPPDTTLNNDDEVRVRLVQLNPTNDSFIIDTLSLFDESIVWEFSVDGGTTWVTPIGVRNFVNGVLMFGTPGKQLRWRVTGWRDNLSITSLQIRPIYLGRIQTRTMGNYRGPNVSTFDHEPPIQSDPEFSSWGKPIPRTWFLAGRPFRTLPIDPSVPTNEFSKFYARAVDDDISAITDEAIRIVRMARYSTTIYDPDSLPHELDGEFLPTPLEFTSRSGMYYRTASDDAGVGDDASSFSLDDGGAIVRTIVSPLHSGVIEI